jgi:23S rRNA (cytidine1920-2'-O)/16S rRNA (cytidine1409-2'-O)-methyltransferase
MKVRLDKLLVDLGLAPTRTRAQALILAGKILVEGQKVEKAGTPVEPQAAIRLLGGDQRYVSRGGGKLEAAIYRWSIDLSARHCADIGASTGGFTDCMLQHGAATVVAIDTGYGQIAQSLRDDPRVSLQERTNARYLAPGSLPATITFFAMDVAFISATLVLPAVVGAVQSRAGAAPSLEAVILVKPQFEVGRESVGKGGIVRDPVARQMAVNRVRDTVASLGGLGIEIIDSPFPGAEGNLEFLLHAFFPTAAETALSTESAPC